MEENTMAKKVLLVSVTAGYGHHAAAAAISEAVRERGHDVATCDLMALVGKLSYNTIDKGYGFATKYVTKPYGAIFGRMSRRKADAPPTLDAKGLRALTAPALAKELDRYQPDVVVSTHPFGSLAIDELEARGRASVKSYGLVTDYDFHPYWEGVPRSGDIITGADLMKIRAVRRGIARERLLPLGIPVEKRFERDIPQREARERVGVPQYVYTALLMSGSMGFNNFTDEAVELAKAGVYVLCVCGRNAKLRAELTVAKEREGIENMRIYGFVTDGELLMAAADCIVTKPGGLTTTESMVRRLPLVLYGGIPGQEERNAEFLSALGAAMVCARDLPPSEAVQMLREEPWRGDALRNAATKIVTPGAAGRIADEVLR